MNETKERFDGGTHAPQAACVFNCPPESVCFTDGSDEQKRFAIEAYDGGIILNHWYWGNLAFDLDGLKFAGRRTPVLDTHDTAARLGFATKQNIDDEGVHFEGQYLRNARAREVQADMADGFPMQASLSLSPGIIEQVKDGETTEVNGHRLRGPGAVFRQTVIREVSMCVLGAAPNTSSTPLGGGDNTIEFSLTQRKDPIMANEKKTEAVTLESFKAEHPDLYEQALTLGGEAERSRFAELQKACGDDAVLLAQAFAEGWDTEKVHAARAEKLAAENAALKDKLAERQSTPNASQDAATQEFIEQPAPQDEAEKETEFDEATATDEQLREHFAADPELREDFGGNVDEYVAFVAADRDGLVRIKGN